MEAKLRCRCGAVEGSVTNASREAATRVVCCCDDCQAYLHHLARTDLLDPYGGMDVVQVAPASLSFRRGNDRIVGLRLTSKGLYRWYASCCKTPVGNTLGPGFPFVGVVVQALAAGGTPVDDVFGAPIGHVRTKSAVMPPPDESRLVELRLAARFIRTVLAWRFGGQTWPHPFFDRDSRAPSHPITSLSAAERQALRPPCGPRSAGAQGNV